jgi:hypothetical protein
MMPHADHRVQNQFPDFAVNYNTSIVENSG